MFQTAIAVSFLFFFTNAERIEEKQLLPREPKSDRSLAVSCDSLNIPREKGLIRFDVTDEKFQ